MQKRVKLETKTKAEAVKEARQKHPDYAYKKIVQVGFPTWVVVMEKKKTGKGVAKY